MSSGVNVELNLLATKFVSGIGSAMSKLNEFTKNAMAAQEAMASLQRKFNTTTPKVNLFEGYTQSALEAQKALASIRTKQDAIIEAIGRQNEATSRNIGLKRKQLEYEKLFLAYNQDVANKIGVENEATSRQVAMLRKRQDVIKAFEESQKRICEYVGRQNEETSRLVKQAKKARSNFGHFEKKVAEAAKKQKAFYDYIGRSNAQASKLARTMGKLDANGAIKGFAQMEKSAKKINDSISKLANKSVTVTVNQKTQKSNSGTSFNRSSSSHGGNNVFFGDLKTALGAYIGVEAIGKLIQTSDELTNITARIAMVNDQYNKLNGTKLKSAKLQEMIYDAANRSRASFFDTAQVVSRIGMNAGGAFKSSEELVAFAELMQKSFIVAGTNAEEMRSAMLQLSQGMASNRLQGDELRSIFESAPVIANYIADYMGVGIGEVRELAAEGKITAEIVKNAFFNASNDIDKKFKQMPKTFTQIWNIFKNKALEAWQPLYDRLSKFANSNTFDAAFNTVVRGINALAQAAIHVVNVVDSGIKIMRENAWWLIPIVGGVTIALTLQGIAASFAAGGAARLAIASAWAKVEAWGHTAATIASTFAQQGFNAALAACPLSWIIGLIVAFIVVIYLAVGAINKLADTSYSATGLIAGSFMWLAGIAWNVCAIIWNAFASLVEFLWNVWTKPEEAGRRFFGNIAIACIDTAKLIEDIFGSAVQNVLNALIGLINTWSAKWNSWMDSIPKGLGQSFKVDMIAESNLHKRNTKALTDARNNVQSWMGKSSSGYQTIQRMKVKDLGEEFSQGYKKGRDFENSVKGKFDIFKEYGYNDKEVADLMKKWGFDNKTDFADFLKGNDQDYAQDNLGSSGTPYMGVLKDIAENTGKSDDLADIEWMRSLGSREATNRFTTKEIKLTMNNTNNISKDADSNTFIGLLVEEFKRAMATSAEGA